MLLGYIHIRPNKDFVVDIASEWPVHKALELFLVPKRKGVGKGSL